MVKLRNVAFDHCYNAHVIIAEHLTFNKVFKATKLTKIGIKTKIGSNTLIQVFLYNYGLCM